MSSQINAAASKHPFLLVYTFVVYALQYTFTAIMVIIGIGVSYLGVRTIIKFGSFFWARTIFFLMGKRIRIRGLENIDRNDKHLLIANHTSIYDIPAIMTIIPDIAWIGRQYLADIFGFGHLLKMLNYVPIEPGQPQKSRESIDQAIAHAKNGLTVAIFPEGTRTVSGQLSPFKKGFIHIARASDLDIIPITLNGFWSLKPKDRRYIDPRGKLEIVIHPAIKRESIGQLSNEELLIAACDAIAENYQQR